MKQLLKFVMLSSPKWLTEKYPSLHLIKGSCFKLPSIRDSHPKFTVLLNFRKYPNTVLQGQSSSHVRMLYKAFHSYWLYYMIIADREYFDGCKHCMTFLVSISRNKRRRAWINCCPEETKHSTQFLLVLPTTISGCRQPACFACPACACSFNSGSTILSIFFILTRPR